MMNNNSTTNCEKKPIIDNDEALRLIDLIQQGDSNAENELAELGSVFVKAVAKQYVGKGLSDEALIAASRYGMLRASHKFDKSRGFKFASYAVWWMRQAILQEIRKKKTTKRQKNMIRKNWGDDGALTLIKVVLERTEDQELREQLLEFLQNNEELRSDAHKKDFYGFATTLAKEWLASNQS